MQVGQQRVHLPRLAQLDVKTIACVAHHQTTLVVPEIDLSYQKIDITNPTVDCDAYF